MAETIMPSFSEQDSLATVSADLGSKSSASGVTGNDAFSKINTLNSKFSRTLLGVSSSPYATMEINLSDSVLNYDYIQIIARKNGNGTFMSTIIHHDDVGVGNNDVISLTAYNNSSYNAYIECGFPTNTKFSMPTFRQTGWTIKPIYIVGIGKNT